MQRRRGAAGAGPLCRCFLSVTDRMTRWLKTCLILPLLLGLVSPKIGAVLLDLHPNITQVVICTGSETVTLRLGADGTPVETRVSEDVPCVLGEAVPGARQAAAGWTQLARRYPARFQAVPNRRPRHLAALLNRDSRAPPVV